MTREPEPAKIGERHEFPKAGGSCRYTEYERRRIRNSAFPASTRPRLFAKGGHRWNPATSTHPVDAAARAERAA